MAGKWITDVILLIEPEESQSLPDRKCKHVMASPQAMQKSSVSAKALLWIAISILAGLAIGQLH